MSSLKTKEMLVGNINFLSTQIQPWVAKYKCRNGFDLFNHDFGGDSEEKVKIMGYIHRRDAYIQILNQLEYEQTSIQSEIQGSDTGVVSAARKLEIIGNAFKRKVEELLPGDVNFSGGLIESSLNEEDYTSLVDSIYEFDLKRAITKLAVIWYNEEVERLTPAIKLESEPEPEPDDTRPCDVA